MKCTKRYAILKSYIIELQYQIVTHYSNCIYIFDTVLIPKISKHLSIIVAVASHSISRE